MTLDIAPTSSEKPRRANGIAKTPALSKTAMKKARTDSREVRYVNVADIRVAQWVTNNDEGYQRSIRGPKLDKMIRDYEEGRLTIPVLSEREDGSLWALDGQHRIEMLKALGVQVVMADIRHGLTLGDEARLFYQLNDDQTAVDRFDKFNARVSAGEPKAVAILKAVHGWGYRMDRGGTGDRGIAAAAALEYVYDLGPAVLNETLETLSVAFRADSKALDAQFIAGLGTFLHSWRDDPKFSRDRMLDTFTAHAAIEIIKAWRRARLEVGGDSNSSRAGIAAALQAVYNGNRKKGRLTGRPKSAKGRSMGHIAPRR